MGAATFAQAQLELMGSVSLDDFAAFLSFSLVPARSAAERRLASLPRALLRSSNILVLGPSKLASELLEQARCTWSWTVNTSALPLGRQAGSSALAQALAALAPRQRQAHAEAAVLRMLRDLAGTSGPQLDVKTPLMDAGVDSLAATELASRLRALVGVPLSPTVVFEHPTPRAVASHLLEQLHCEAEASVVVAPCVLADTGAPLEIVSAVSRWPGACNGDVSCTQVQAACGDAVGSLPQTRWVLSTEAVSTDALSSTQIACVGHSGFVSGAQRFDAAAFGIFQAEASTMDPQQRLLLEDGYGYGYCALHGSSQRRVTLLGGDGGVFVGIERPD